MRTRSCLSISALPEASRRQSVTTAAARQASGDATDRRHADTRAVRDLAIRQFLAQQPDDAPAVGERLQFGRAAQVAQEVAAFVRSAQGQERLVERALGGGFLARADAAVV